MKNLMENEKKVSYKEDEAFKADRQTYITLSDRVRSFDDQAKKTKSNLEKIGFLRNLCQALTDFDLHLREMINKYPDYYADMKPYLDELLRQNGIFFEASQAVIRSLNKTVN